MKICLATLHANPSFTPLSLLYLKASVVDRLRYPPDDVAILEGAQDADPDVFVTQILATTPAIVGFSCYVWNIKTLMAAARRIKARAPDTIIVLGGPEVGPIAIDVLRANPAIDVVVNSEGEVPFAELIARWRDGDAIDEVRGICRRRGAEIIAHDDAPIVKELGDLSSPHLARFLDLRGRVACIETQRGCVFRCNFCFYNKDLSIRNRRFSLDRVKAEILVALEAEASEIYLMDPIFNLHAERAKEICRFIAAHNDRRVGVQAEVWAEFIDEELATLMRDANFQFLEVGLQSTDGTALATAERRLRIQRFEEGIGYLKAYGIKFELQLIFGLPGDTLASFRKSLNYACSLDPDFLAVFPLMVLPGTELWRKAEGLNLRFDPEPPYLVRSHFSMTADEIAYGDKIMEALEYLRNSRTARSLSREPGVTFAEMIDGWIHWRKEEAWPEAATPNAKLFIAHFCGQTGIDAGAYLGMASWEFGG
ncbi:MAG TPA: radical SAM protein [Vicinamibacterales bacterium]|nr:radical SAM protein [Vicinamibacterales bacterium]